MTVSRNLKGSQKDILINCYLSVHTCLFIVDLSQLEFISFNLSALMFFYFMFFILSYWDVELSYLMLLPLICHGPWEVINLNGTVKFVK